MCLGDQPVCSPLPAVGASLPAAAALGTGAFGPQLWDQQPARLHPEEAAALG